MQSETTFDPYPLAAIDDLPGSLAQRVYVSLRDAIMSLAIPPGAVLRKAPISERLGVSRAPVSEAIIRLASEGLVDVVPQSGTRVSRFSMDEIREAAFMRAALEVAAASRVALRRSEDQLAQLTRNIRLQQLLAEDTDFVGFYQADEDFHTLLLSFTGYPGLNATVDTISLKLKRPRILLLPTVGRLAETVAEHSRIVDAIREKDATASEAAMREHLSSLILRLAPLEKAHPDYFRPNHNPGNERKE